MTAQHFSRLAAVFAVIALLQRAHRVIQDVADIRFFR